MKKMNLKTILLGLSLLAFTGVTTSCSKDDNEEQTSASIDPAVGTYKGKLYLYDHNLPNTDQYEFYDAILIVTKEANNKLKVTAKSGELYSGVTTKTFTVETGAFFGSNTKDIVALTGSVEGIFNFYGSTKTINLITSKQGSTEISYNFEGTKQ